MVGLWRESHQEPQRADPEVHDVVERCHMKIPNSTSSVIAVKSLNPVKKNPERSASTAWLSACSYSKRVCLPLRSLISGVTSVRLSGLGLSGRRGADRRLSRLRQHA